MKRKPVLFGLVSLSVLLLGGAGLALLVRHEPSFYRQACFAPSQVRKQHSGEFMCKFFELLTDIREKNQWYDTFTSEQLNSYFQEDFKQHGAILPDDIREPRLSFENDKLRLAFRYGRDPWSTIVSIDLRVWLAPKDANVVMLELQGMHAGSLPISAQSLLEKLSEGARTHNMEVTWYRSHGNPTAMVRLQTDRATPSFRLQRLELRSGEFFILGCANEEPPARVAIPAIGLAPTAN